MRHLIVPSVDTQHWLEKIKANNWWEPGYLILPHTTGQNAIPLNDQAPDEHQSCWQSLTIVEINRNDKSAKQWTDLLAQDLFKSLEEHWPKSFEVIGDILTVKLEDDVLPYQHEIAEAMLQKHPSIRLVCADKGVHGEFRVRHLVPIAARNEDYSTLTTLKEGGKDILIDPTKSYYSTRLHNERLGNLLAARQLAQQLGRPINVCDPYAGVGPAIAKLLLDPELVGMALIGDLNPEAVELLRKNIQNHTRKRATELITIIQCQDARIWKNNSDYIESIDFLLVNLPHDTLSHITDLLPLIKKNTPSLIRGWAIIDRDDMMTIQQDLSKQFAEFGATDLELNIAEIKGYSATQIFVRVESWQTFI